MHFLHDAAARENGRSLEGLALNQGAVDLQLLGDDRRIHLLRKSGDRYRPVTSQTDWPSYNGQTTGTTLIPAGTYPHQKAPARTVGIDLLLVCRANLSNDLVYKLTRAYFEELPERIRRLTDPQRAPATVIPLHPGAARYYREREMHR